MTDDQLNLILINYKQTDS